MTKFGAILKVDPVRIPEANLKWRAMFLAHVPGESLTGARRAVVVLLSGLADVPRIHEVPRLDDYVETEAVE